MDCLLERSYHLQMHTAAVDHTKFYWAFLAWIGPFSLESHWYSNELHNYAQMYRKVLRAWYPEPWQFEARTWKEQLETRNGMPTVKPLHLLLAPFINSTDTSTVCRDCVELFSVHNLNAMVALVRWPQVSNTHRTFKTHTNLPKHKPKLQITNQIPQTHSYQVPGVLILRGC